MSVASLRYLLDTNIVSELVRNPQGKAATRIAELGEESVCTSIIVASELRLGAEKSGSIRLRKQLDAVMLALEVLPFESPADHHYAEIRKELESAGTPIGPNDLLIAAHARALGLTVITVNLNEFCRVPGLQAENWLSG